MFLDDIPENIRGAAAAGFRTVLFHDYDAALLQIAENGWLTPYLLERKETR